MLTSTALSRPPLPPLAIALPPVPDPTAAFPVALAFPPSDGFRHPAPPLAATCLSSGPSLPLPQLQSPAAIGKPGPVPFAPATLVELPGCPPVPPPTIESSDNEIRRSASVSRFVTVSAPESPPLPPVTSVFPATPGTVE